VKHRNLIRRRDWMFLVEIGFSCHKLSSWRILLRFLGRGKKTTSAVIVACVVKEGEQKYVFKGFYFSKRGEWNPLIMMPLFTTKLPVITKSLEEPIHVECIEVKG